MFHVEHGEAEKPEEEPARTVDRDGGGSGEEKTTKNCSTWNTVIGGPWAPGSDQIPCWLTHTTAQTHQIIRDNLGTRAN